MESFDSTGRYFEKQENQILYMNMLQTVGKSVPRIQ